jgi:hypothetical protein
VTRINGEVGVACVKDGRICCSPLVCNGSLSGAMRLAMNSNPDLDQIEPELDDIPEEDFLTCDPIGLTFVSGIHESDLLLFVERARRLAGEVC